MPKRRKVLIGLGGAVALAGCSEETEEEAPEESESESEPESDTEPEPESEEETEEESATETQDEPEQQEEEGPEPEPAEFEFTDIQPDGESVNYGDEIQVETTIENIGGQEGTTTVEYYVDDELIDELEVTLDAGEDTVLTASILTDLYSEGELTYRLSTENDEISASIEITIKKPDTQSFSGTGQSVEDGVEIVGGLTIIEATHSGESNFQVSLVDGSQYDDNFINVIGDFDGAQADLIDAGEYLLDVNADGSWSIDIHQPRSGSGEGLPKSLSGSGPDVVGPIEFDGTHVASGSHSGESNFQVQVYPMEGSFSELVFNEIGEFDGETTFSFDGVGWVDVNADGSWQITME